MLAVPLRLAISTLLILGHVSAVKVEFQRLLGDASFTISKYILYRHSGVAQV